MKSPTSFPGFPGEAQPTQTLPAYMSLEALKWFVTSADEFFRECAERRTSPAILYEIFAYTLYDSADRFWAEPHAYGPVCRETIQAAQANAPGEDLYWNGKLVSR